MATTTPERSAPTMPPAPPVGEAPDWLAPLFLIPVTDARFAPALLPMDALAFRPLTGPLEDGDIVAYELPPTTATAREWQTLYLTADLDEATEQAIGLAVARAPQWDTPLTIDLPAFQRRYARYTVQDGRAWITDRADGEDGEDLPADCIPLVGVCCFHLRAFKGAPAR